MYRLLAILFCVTALQAAPVFLDDQFELPEGFRIYRAAEKELTGGSYALRFDGQGRLLVGDGTALRRLIDKDNDGVFDSYEIIATGLGWRGPQGILVYGDKLFCVGGDGIQMYEGYTNGPLRHLGRIGEKFNTGGDHDGHTLLRGHDGYIYFMAGNGAGITNRTHITEETSPCLIEREASIFRISPDGKKWECVANGGRNPHNLGMNYLGDLFSFDSDMEWHVGLPWYRPCRLNHWVIGGDQGWQEVGAYPPYYIDNLPGILDVGRGSPTWGVFYEHNQFPKKYHNAYLVCDYRWKDQSNDEYRTTGRLVSFFLERSGSRWKAKMETLARPKPGAKDANGRSIPFALVDIDVAPDGSIYLTEHNQGIWRIVYDPEKKLNGAPGGPSTLRANLRVPLTKLFDELDLVNVPQPSSEWARLLQERFVQNHKQFAERLRWRIKEQPVIRLKAVRFLGAYPEYISGLSEELSRDTSIEVRAQAAWIAGLRGREDDIQVLVRLLKDFAPFVRRRSIEALTPHMSARFLPNIEELLNDSDCTVRYAATITLSHLPTDSWFERLASSKNNQVLLRALTAASLRNEKPSTERVQAICAKLVDGARPALVREDALDFLRVMALYREELGGDVTRRSSWQMIASWLRRGFPSGDPEMDWERARLMAAFSDSMAYPYLLKELQSSSDPVRQFHFFECIAKLPSGWTHENEKTLLDWTLTTQKGWFAEFHNKGVEFPLFLQTALEEFASHHQDAVLESADKIQIDSLLGSALLGVIAERDPQRLFAMYRQDESEAHKVKVLQTLARLPKPETSEFLRSELKTLQSPALRKTAIASLKAMPKSPENEPFLKEPVASNKPERPDAEIHKAIMNASLEAGDALRGRKIYERLQCNSCHGGGQTPGQEGRIFGPDLAGVTSRLTRAELADSIVYPSKQVADRFKAVAITLKDGRELTGFITEKTDDHITFADAQTIHRLSASEIEKTAPQEKSLMPEGLVRTLSDQEIAHLLKFLSSLGTAPK